MFRDQLTHIQGSDSVVKMYKIENVKPKYCLSITLMGKTMNYLAILFTVAFLAFTVYVKCSRYIFMHNFANESPFERYAFQAVCICYGEFIVYTSKLFISSNCIISIFNLPIILRVYVLQIIFYFLK